MLSDWYEGTKPPSINQIAECFDVLSLLYHSHLSQFKTRKKVTNKRASEYDISVAFPFSAIKISKPQQN
jgi:hypothetical protein